jgi:predicted ester cyclase
MSEAETTIRRFYESLATGDLALVDQALTPDWEAVPALPTGPGAEGWKGNVKQLRSVFSDFDISIEDLIFSGDRVVVRSINRATHTGVLLGAPATGKRLEFRSTDIHRLENGRIVQSWHLLDFFGLVTQAGLTFAPAA